jgi:hypothetical protein
MYNTRNSQGRISEIFERKGRILILSLKLIDVREDRQNVL